MASSRSEFCLFALVVVFAAPRPAVAITISGVEFTDAAVIDAEAATHVLLTTTQDVYLFAPAGLFADTVTLEASLSIIFGPPFSITTHPPGSCTRSTCPTAIHDLDADVVLRVFDPLGDFSVTAGGSIVLSMLPIPEPSPALLVGVGLVALAGRRGSAS